VLPVNAALERAERGHWGIENKQHRGAATCR
jgi:hypothetical protein